MRRELVERLGALDLPAVKGRAFALLGLHDDALLAVVHAEGQRVAAAVDELKAEKPGRVGAPVLELSGADPDIAKGLQIHGESLRTGPAWFYMDWAWEETPARAARFDRG